MQLDFLRPAWRLRGGLSSVLAWTSMPTVFVPLLLATVVAACFHLTNLDLTVSGCFYDADTTSWPCFASEPYQSIYCFGCLPSLALGIGGLAVALFGRLWTPARRLRKEGLFLALFLILGPGILVNAILKPAWGRPRPVQVRHFGGDRDFLPVGLIGSYDDSKSFPSGHAAMGFFLMAPGFILLRRHRRAARAFFALGLVYGSIMGATRVAQGGHFPSDVIASGLLVYFTGLALYFAMGFHREISEAGDPMGRTDSADARPLPKETEYRRAA